MKITHRPDVRAALDRIGEDSCAVLDLPALTDDDRRDIARALAQELAAALEYAVDGSQATDLRRVVRRIFRED